jgi:hypothetical protein
MAQAAGQGRAAIPADLLSVNSAQQNGPEVGDAIRSTGIAIGILDSAHDGEAGRSR